MLDTITNSLAFGLIAMVIVGGSWSLVGLVMGDAPKKGIDSSIVQFYSGFIPVSLGIILIGCQGGLTFENYSCKTFLFAFICYGLGGFTNFFMLENMSKAMQRGPNGIIWSIIQSAMVFPFIVGILFFGVEINIFRILGIIALLASLVFFGLAKNNVSTGKSWKFLAFLCLAICAFQQNLMTIPSYYEEVRKISSITLTTMTSIGSLSAAIVFALTQKREYWQKLATGVKNVRLWQYILVLQGFSLVFAYTLFYPGMKVMGKAGLGGMCYPLLVGSCIVTFTLTSILFLKEKLQAIQAIALVTCILGLVFICL